MKRILSLLLVTVIILVSLPAVSASERYVEVIPFIYDGVGSFSEGLAAVCIDGKCGFIDKSGNEVIPLKYNTAYNFSDGMAVVGIGSWETGYKMGLIDKNGNEITPLKYDDVRAFSEGLAAVQIDGKWGYIDRDGNEVIPFKYGYYGYYAGNFSEGLAMVMIDYKVGYIDKDGNEIVPFIYDYDYYNNTGDFSDGLAAVNIYDLSQSQLYAYHGECGYIDRDGNEVIPIKFDYASDFSDGVAVVGILRFRVEAGGVTGGKEYYLGVIDRSGNEVLPLEYDYIGDFSDGLAVFGNSLGTGRFGMGVFREYGIIDKFGNVIVTPKYDSLHEFSEGLAAVRIGDGETGKWGFIDKSGNEVIPLKYDWVNDFSEGMAAVMIGNWETGKWGFIDKSGNEVIPLIFDSVGAFSEGMVAVSNGEKWGFISFVPEKPPEWAQPEVNAAIEAGIVPEKLQVLYTQSTTRAEFCALAVMLYENIKGEITERATFNDTNDINVEKAAAIGVVKGVGDDKFAPNSSLTREQAATMLSRLADIIGKPLTQAAAEFNDNNDIAEWAFEAVGQMQITGVMTGIGDDKFAPKSPYTREQSIMTVLRLYNIIKKNTEF